MDLGLKGRVALVCGASRGLGRACATALAAEGVELVIVARGREALQEAAQSIFQQTGSQVVPVEADITTPEGRTKALAGARKLAYGRAAAFDIVVTNAGGPPPGDFRDWDFDDWHRALDANMLTPIDLMKATLDGMAERGWGRIVNITSTAVKAPSGYLGLSNGARSGLTGFVAGLARQVAGQGVTINNLLPGTFDTDRLTSNLKAAAELARLPPREYVQSRIRAIPALRFGEAKELGALCAFVCSEHAAYMTGQNLLVDGGAYPGTF